MHEKIKARGEYFIRVNRGAWTRIGNLITDEGLSHILNVAFGAEQKPQGYYIAIHSGTATPAANWTGATYATAASEIVSLTEGHTSATRPQWNPDPANGGVIDNINTAAEFIVATSSVLTVTGCALLTSAQRGGTSGVLVSAVQFPNVRQLQDGDRFELGYRITLTR